MSQPSNGLNSGALLSRGDFPIDDCHSLAQARQFTDVSRFKLRCLVCQRALGGQVDAMNHAKLTGHSNFGEV